MRLEELYLLLKETGYPVAYSHFNNNVTIPFITYLVTENPNFLADNKVYKNIQDINIELYTAEKDLEAERLLEELLNENEIVWEAKESWIKEEKIYQKIYEVRLI